MPIYVLFCGRCFERTQALMSYKEFDEFREGAHKVSCSSCNTEFSPEDRDISKNVSKTVIGCSKGNY